MTFDEFVADWRKAEKLPKDPNIKITCICGQCKVDDRQLTNDQLLDIYNILQGNPDQPLTLKDVGN